MFLLPDLRTFGLSEAKSLGSGLRRDDGFHLHPSPLPGPRRIPDAKSGTELA